MYFFLAIYLQYESYKSRIHDYLKNNILTFHQKEVLVWAYMP